MPTHLHVGATRAEKTPAEWLKLASQIAQQCNAWADRYDIVGYVGPGVADGKAAACWRPAIAEMEVNVEAAFGEGTKPKYVGDFTHRKTHFEYPVAAGAVMHEAGHARFTRFPLEQIFAHSDKLVGSIAELFEETRIEGLMRKLFPRNRSFLRASALELSLGEINADEVKASGVAGISTLLLFTLARVDAGILHESDVAEIRDIAEAALGKSLVANLRELWLKAQAHADHFDAAPLIKLAEEWVQLLVDSGAMTAEEAAARAKGLKPRPEGEPCPEDCPCRAPKGEDGEPGEPGEHPEEIPEEIRKMLEDMLEAMGEAAAEIHIGAASEAAEQEIAEAREAEVAERAAEAAEQAEHEKSSKELFSKGTGPVADTRTGSRLIEKRKPSSAERAAAVKVGALLDKARYQDRVVTPVKKALPPGRLNTRAAVQGVADLRTSGQTNATPWRAKQRRHTEDPNLTIGFMGDISGSMGSAMQPLSVCAWIFSEAAHRISARVAMTYYGSGVFPVLKPGQRLDEVTVYSAPDGTERFDKAFKATDGALNLLHGSGARLLVIASDMCYTGNEETAAQKWVKRCIEAGVAVMILTFDGYASSPYLKPYEKLGALVIADRFDPAAAATVIGKHAAAAIEKASAKRNAG